MDREKIREIFERLADDLEDLVPELNPRASGARYIVVDCPGCGERGRAYLYRPDTDHPEPRIRCNRQGNCAYSKSLLDYLIERDRKPFFEVLRDLAERAHVDLPRSSPEAEERFRMARKENEDLEKYMDFFRASLWGGSEKGKETLSYLRGRGYSDEDIQAMGLGCFPGKAETLLFQGQALKRESHPKALSHAMKGSMDDYRIIFPYRGPDGSIQNFMGRLIREPGEGEGKYQPMGDYAGVQAQGPFNLHAVRGETAIVVEGFMDALLAEARGISNVVALTNSHLIEGQGEVLRKHGVKNLILALDNDKAGLEGTESIIREALKEGTFSTYVASFQGAKDPDELIRNKGAGAFLEAIKKAKTEGRGVKWLLSRIGEKEDLSTDLGKQEAFKKMTEVTKILSNPLDRQEAKNFIAEALRIDPWDLEPFLEQARERAQKEKLSRDLQRLAQEVQKEAPENPDTAIALLQGTLEIIGRGQRTSLAEAFFPPFSMEDLVTKLQRAGEGLPTGYPALDEKARFPKGAVSLVAGRPGHGKTTFLLNLLRKQIERDPRKRYLFLTYEEDTHWLITKLLVSMANWNLGSNPDNLLGAYQAFIRGDFRPSGEDTSNLPEIQKVWDYLRGLLEDQKVIFAYRPGDIREMAQAIRGMRDKWGDELEAVFLDYMQIVPAPEDMTGSSSYQRVQGISALVRDTAVETNLPIIAGAQLSRRALDKAGTKTFTLEQVLRPEFLREAGDLEQDANLILGLYNKTTGAQEESGVNNGDSIPPFSVSILKNRNGPCGGKPIGLSYFPKEWRIEAGGDIFDDVKPRR
mgnify:CR=1 FL=1